MLKRITLTHLAPILVFLIVSCSKDSTPSLTVQMTAASGADCDFSEHWSFLAHIPLEDSKPFDIHIMATDSRPELGVSYSLSEYGRGEGAFCKHPICFFDNSVGSATAKRFEVTFRNLDTEDSSTVVLDYELETYGANVKGSLQGTLKASTGCFYGR